MDVKEWRAFLLNWQKEILQCTNYINDYDVFSVFPELKNGPILMQGNEDDIKILESKLGKALPASYRNFFIASSGWIHITMFSTYLSPNEANWFYETNKEWVDIWIESSDDYEVTDEDYFVYGEMQDPIYVRGKYMKSCLKISTDQDGYVFLLNPEIVTDDGEWEAWAFGTKLPGAYRYRTFEDLMRKEYETALEDIKVTGFS